MEFTASNVEELLDGGAAPEQEVVSPEAREHRRVGLYQDAIRAQTTNAHFAASLFRTILQEQLTVGECATTTTTTTTVRVPPLPSPRPPPTGGREHRR